MSPRPVRLYPLHSPAPPLPSLPAPALFARSVPPHVPLMRCAVLCSPPARSYACPFGAYYVGGGQFFKASSPHNGVTVCVQNTIKPVSV